MLLKSFIHITNRKLNITRKCW